MINKFNMILIINKPSTINNMMTKIIRTYIGNKHKKDSKHRKPNKRNKHNKHNNHNKHTKHYKHNKRNKLNIQNKQHTCCCVLLV